MISFVKCFLRLSALCAALAAHPAAYAQEVLKMRVDFIPYVLHAPFHYANAQGWYKQQGIDLTIDDGSGSHRDPSDHAVFLVAAAAHPRTPGHGAGDKHNALACPIRTTSREGKEWFGHRA